MGGVVATNTNDDVSLFFLSLKQWFFPVLLPASGTAIEIRYVDACCRGPSRGSEACHLHIWSVFLFQAWGRSHCGGYHLLSFISHRLTWGRIFEPYK